MKTIPRYGGAIIIAAFALFAGEHAVSQAQNVTQQSSSKNITVKGRIRDGKNVSLPGVTVVVKEQYLQRYRLR